MRQSACGILPCLFLAINYVTAHECGRYGASIDSWANEKRIANGHRAKCGQFPSYVKIEITTDDHESNPRLCGGTLIDDEHVLTAAHCFAESFKIGPKIVAIKVYKGFTNDFLAHGLTGVCISPKYTLRPFYWFWGAEHDIAIVKLSGKIEFDYEVQPACLPTREAGSDQAYLMGKGLNETMENSDTLRVLEVKHSSCGTFMQHPSVICFAANKRVGRACAGDSGGPVISLQDGRQTVVGVTSYGAEGCETFGYPTGTANVYKLRHEIESACHIHAGDPSTMIGHINKIIGMISLLGKAETSTK